MKLFLIALLALGAPLLRAEPRLALAPQATDLSFTLSNATGTTPWVLQHSSDGSTWEDLAFFAQTRDGSVQPDLTVARGLLVDPNTPGSFFRAVQLAEDNLFLRRFLTERAKWRLSNSDGYRYTLYQWQSWTFWRGIINASDGAVSTFRMLEEQSFGGTPEIPTIEGLFARIANAIAQDAHQINVTWHPTLGYPVTCYIDLVEFIADEERGWTIESFELTP